MLFPPIYLWLDSLLSDLASTPALGASLISDKSSSFPFEKGRP